MHVVFSAESLEPLEDALCLVETGVICHTAHDDKAITCAHILLTHRRVLLLSRCVKNVQHTSLQREKA